MKNFALLCQVAVDAAEATVRAAGNFLPRAPLASNEKVRLTGLDSKQCILSAVETTFGAYSCRKA